MNINTPPTLLRDGTSFSAATPARRECLKALAFLAAVALGGCAHSTVMASSPTIDPPRPAVTAAQEVERLYREYSKNTNQVALVTLMKKHPKANRTGCAVMYAAQRATDANERERLLKLAIEKYGDCRYGDGVQVAAQARWYLANLYNASGKPEEARKLYNELKTDYPDAVNHKGRKFSEFLLK